MGYDESKLFSFTRCPHIGSGGLEVAVIQGLDRAGFEPAKA
jgi:hypothetical protein